MRRVIAFACLCLTLALGGCVTSGEVGSASYGDPFWVYGPRGPYVIEPPASNWFGLSIGSGIRHGPPFGPPFGQAYGRHRRGCQPLYALDPFWSRYRQVGVVC